MKGIVLAGGTGSRLYPMTMAASKQLLPVFDKPMIFYPISVLMLAGIRDIVIITTPHDREIFERLLGDGSRFGVSFTYLVQQEPEGIAQAFVIAEEVIGSDPCALILGDNIFYGGGLGRILLDAATLTDGALVYSYPVSDPERYGVVEFGSDGRAVSIEEKPQKPRSNHAVTGLYFYDGTACERARSLTPSPRGELEITDLNRTYMDEGKLSVQPLGRGFAWLDTGTPDSLLEASQYVAAIEKRQGMKICCPEEIALRRGFITPDQLEQNVGHYGKSEYGAYLRRLLTQTQ
ncbi:glucose-1-phosphate thymidylyltransferase RfbA [Henriciella marina]|uniref:glucose-1-phosphate thymidylyltransferase RfbA n=1 Tax=Henriciella marina TaxID=453851 RepID=UPI0003788126|nr:glucose-1-phosphate thymidylyltransferase RfbA [Henriciella marina]